MMICTNTEQAQSGNKKLGYMSTVSQDNYVMEMSPLLLHSSLLSMPISAEANIAVLYYLKKMPINQLICILIPPEVSSSIISFTSKMSAIFMPSKLEHL
ncbi:Hypothetical predicted protein [Scomber scombrus]|uniref:Uncharacterized protein n=1 Tax=Scomber scombrus TaxID=13677 RepID=A0AAV1MZV8_SCOSC